MTSFKQAKEDLYQTVFTELKILGVKVPKIKKFRTNISKQKSTLYNKQDKIFGVSLSEQEWVSHGEYSLPKFLLMATTYLQKFTDKEGLFRKAGNISRQRKLKLKLEKGESLQECDPNDVACLLKQWLRELPDPIVPHYLQNLFVRCQNLDSEKDCVSACVLTCLLLPPDHLHCLRHLLHFLADVASNSKKSRMGIYNLALLMAPNVFATNDSIGKVSSYTNNLVYQHTAVMKILIENSDKVGRIPQSIFLQQSFPRPKSTASLDMLNSASKSKKKLKTALDIISGFKKLVGQNGATVTEKVPVSEENLSETSFPRQALSVDNLDERSLTETQNLKDVFQTPENSGSRHTRRKSFGTLLLRRKNKKRTEDSPQKLKLNIFEKILREHKDSKEKLKMYKSQDTIDVKDNFHHLLNGSVSSVSEINLSSIHLSDTKQSDSQLSEISSDFNKLLRDESYKLRVESKLTANSFPQSSMLTSECLKDEQENTIYEKTIVPKEEISKKKHSAKITFSNPEIDVRKVRSKDSRNTCLHKKSICNIKCDKNNIVKSESTLTQKKINERMTSYDHSNTVKSESILTQKNINEKMLSRDQSNSNRMSDTLHADILKEKRLLSKQASPISLKTEEQSIAKATQIDSRSTEVSTPQSMDLSLSLLLQNFCLSPPSDSKEIRLSIDITSDKNNPELKVNISQREVSPNQTDTSGKSCQVTEHKPSSVVKSRRRLSSNSDSRIPRLKKSPCHRPNSFPGNQLKPDCKINTHKTSGHSNLLTSHSTKIPVMCSKNEFASLPIQEESMSDSCFQTPGSSFLNSDSVPYIDESNYLSAICSPEEEGTYNKRESIARILKENTGHVKEKVNLYDSKSQSQSSFCSSVTKSNSENGKLLRTSSEKYRTRHKDKMNCYSSSNYDSSKRGGSLRNKSYKSTLTTPPKFTLTDMDTPSPALKQIKEN